MKDTDFQHIHHIKTYCENIAETVVHFGNDYNIFESAHAYISINKSVIWESATRDVPAVLDFCTKIIEQNEEVMDQKQDMEIKMEKKHRWVVNIRSIYFDLTSHIRTLILIQRLSTLAFLFCTHQPSKALDFKAF